MAEQLNVNRLKTIVTIWEQQKLRDVCFFFFVSIVKCTIFMETRSVTHRKQIFFRKEFGKNLFKTCFSLLIILEHSYIVVNFAQIQIHFFCQSDLFICSRGSHSYISKDIANFKFSAGKHINYHVYNLILSCFTTSFKVYINIIVQYQPYRYTKTLKY